MNTPTAEKYVGIDVSKTQLDIAVGQTGEAWNAGNTDIGIAKTVERLQQLGRCLVVVESTGGLERPLLREMQAAGVTFALNL